VTDEYTVTVRREIAASADELFDAWLDEESLGAWMRPGTVRETRAEVDPKVGGGFRIVMVDDDNDFVHVGTYHEIDRPRRLVFTWSSPATHHRESLVTVTFEPSAGSTVVEIRQVGLPDTDAQASHISGWTDALRVLANWKDTAP
jgi:uncharacterized protein YndB with AHSA1/START domain